ncbi:hypothetical protein FACS189431_2730 [Alphaproteobacteria bacterium]|nr:hypothetical protein FACS189431_2730 [Alphaproteobacteria bacterium]
MDFTEVNSRIKVVATFKPDVDIGHAVMPVKMLYRGREIVFTELGLYHPTVAGKRMIHVFDMTDGQSDYRLELDAERLTWTLVSMIST